MSGFDIYSAKSKGVHLYMGKVKPAMKEKTDDGKLFYDCWFKPDAGGTCKHIAAAMYSLEDLLNTFEKDSPTKMPCVWTKKPTTDSRPCDVKDLKIERCELPLKKRKNEHIYCEHIDINIRHKNDQDLPSDESLKTFTVP